MVHVRDLWCGRQGIHTACAFNNNKQYFQRISPANTKLIRVVLSHSRLNWNLEMLNSVEGGKPQNPEKKPSEQGRKPTTNSTHVWCQVQESSPGHIGGRRALLPLCHLCSPAQFTDLSRSIAQLMLGDLCRFLPTPPSWSLDILAFHMYLVR